MDGKSRINLWNWKLETGIEKVQVPKGKRREREERKTKGRKGKGKARQGQGKAGKCQRIERRKERTWKERTKEVVLARIVFPFLFFFFSPFPLDF